MSFTGTFTLLRFNIEHMHCSCRRAAINVFLSILIVVVVVVIVFNALIVAVAPSLAAAAAAPHRLLDDDASTDEGDGMLVEGAVAVAEGEEGVLAIAEVG